MPGQRNVGFTYYKKLYIKLPVELLAEKITFTYFSLHDKKDKKTSQKATFKT